MSGFDPAAVSEALGPIDDAVETHHGQVRLAYRLAQSYASSLMFVHGVGWWRWDGSRWVEDDRGAAQRAVIEVIRSALAESVGDHDLRRDVVKCESETGIRGVLAIAAVLEPFAHTVADLDVDPYMVNVANGTLDLRTMELRPHNPADRLTKITRAAYRPDAQSAEWPAFLERVLPDAEVRAYLQRFAGLALLGRVVEHVFMIATGTGANGKGTAYKAILHALGDYGHVAPADLFMAAKSNPNAATPAQMDLRGRRLVVVSETERDHRLATALMKNLTGGDPITARPLYGSPVTFDPSHTALLVTNFLPKVAGDDPAAWRRIRVVRFDVVIPECERDGTFGDRFELEADAILNWALDGYRDWHQNGMVAPAAVQSATGDYQKASDAVARFIDEKCLTNPQMYAKTSDLHTEWVSWAVDDGAEPMSLKKFSQALDEHGFRMVGGTGRNRKLRVGIGLLSEEDSP